MVFFTKLMINDLKNIVRDRLLIVGCVVGPLSFIIICRSIIPWISKNVYPLEPFYSFLYMMMTIFMPMVFGFVISFLIMDERDENLLTVLRVMPISRTNYLAYRLFFISFISFIFNLFFPFLTGLIDISLLDYLPTAILFTLFTPLIALIINNVANNKIQAFALFKTAGSVFLLPLFAFFIADNWKYILGVIPNFWTFMALDKLLKTGNQDYLHIGIGCVFHIVLLALLMYQFNKKY